MLKIKLKRSVIGSKPKIRKAVKGLGFSRTNQVLERQDTPEIRGMLAKVVDWVDVVDGGKG